MSVIEKSHSKINIIPTGRLSVLTTQYDISSQTKIKPYVKRLSSETALKDVLGSTFSVG